MKKAKSFYSRKIFTRALSRFLLISLVLVSDTKIEAKTNLIGGTDVADVSIYPFMARLHRCAGVIISDSWVLTVAHCVNEMSNVPALTLGFSKTNPIGIAFRIDDYFIKHPDFRSIPISDRYEALYSDFGLIHLKTPIDFEKTNAREITLASPDWMKKGKALPGTLALVLGWGAAKEGVEEESRYLQQVEVPIVSNEVANAPESYNNYIDSRMIAAGLPDGSKDACKNDSGGPLLVYDKELEKYVLVGLVSWAEGCGRPHKYGIYSRVSEAYSWILQQTL